MNIYGQEYSRYDLACAALAGSLIIGACFILSGFIFWLFVVYPGGY